MSNPSKVTGTRAETKVKRYFNSAGLRCERKALAGKEDEGDLRLYLPDGSEMTVEVKAGQQTYNPKRSLMEKWKTQTLEHEQVVGCNAILVVVRHRKRFVDAEVWMPTVLSDEAWTMFYIDDFVSWIICS